MLNLNNLNSNLTNNNNLNPLEIKNPLIKRERELEIYKDQQNFHQEKNHQNFSNIYPKEPEIHEDQSI